MLTKFQNHIAMTDLLPPHAKLVVGVSGGVDSVTLLHLLSELQPIYDWQIAVAHFDHRVRPDSYKDVELVAQLAEDYGYKFDLEKYEGESNTEAAMRKARYEYLESLRDHLGYDSIVTAHHADDAIETAIFNTIRGSDRHGITALRARRGNIVRPLLPFHKAEIVTHAGLQGLPYREDSTNSDVGFSRNFVRHVLVPQGSMQYRNFHHSFTKRLSDLTRLNHKIDSQLDALMRGMLVEQTHDTILLDKTKFRALSPTIATNMLVHIVRTLKPGVNISRQNLAEADKFLASGKTGRTQHLKNGLHLGLSYDTVKVTCQSVGLKKPSSRSAHILTPQTPFENDQFKIVLHPEILDDRGNLESLRLQRQKLLVRHRQPGDKVYPVGMAGSKKLQDVFVNKKVPREMRDAWPIVVNDRNEIVWVPQLLADRRAVRSSSDEENICITCEVI